MKNLILSIALFFLSFQLTFSQEMFSKEVDLSDFLWKFLNIFSTMTHERARGEIDFECYYLLFEVRNGSLDSVIFSENMHSRYLEKYQDHLQESFLENINAELKAQDIRLLRDCKIYVPVFISFVNVDQHDNKIEDNLRLLFPVNQTFDCLYISEPYHIRRHKNSWDKKPQDER